MKSMKIVKKAQAGFTLIELMIVVAIIGILAAVAIPAYQNYVAKSKFAASLSEVSSAKTAYDVMLNDGTTPSTTNIATNGVKTSTGNCVVAVGTAGTSDLTCTIVGGPASVAGLVITLARDTTAGTWTCTSTVAQALIGAVGVCDGA